MTQEQKVRIEQHGLELKKILLDFTGSVTYHLAGNKTDVKFDIREMGMAKAVFVKRN